MLNLLHFSVKGLLELKGKNKVVNYFPNPELPLSPKFILLFSIHLFHKFIYEVHESRGFVYLKLFPKAQCLSNNINPKNTWTNQWITKFGLSFPHHLFLILWVIWSHLPLPPHILCNTRSSSVSMGIGFRTSADTKVHGSSSPIYKMRSICI